MHQDSASVHYNLGVFYETGTGVTKDLGKAVMHYKAAADMGHPKATYNLGVLYLNGHGSADIGQSMLKKGLKEADAAKDPNAAFYLNLCRERGTYQVEDKNEKVQ
ncbi:hypothetical protein MTO96_011084 [Rhipicephalus appendiculatus]